MRRSKIDWKLLWDRFGRILSPRNLIWIHFERIPMICIVLKHSRQSGWQDWYWFQTGLEQIPIKGWGKSRSATIRSGQIPICSNPIGINHGPQISQRLKSISVRRMFNDVSISLFCISDSEFLSVADCLHWSMDMHLQYVFTLLKGSAYCCRFRIFGFSENVDFWSFPVGFGVWGVCNR